MERKLIILYGKMDDRPSKKHQRLIDGEATCGYREYARLFGHIIYMTPQDTKLDWEHSLPDTKAVIAFIKKIPNAVILALKYDNERDSQILARIINKKIYYSCNSRNMINSYCDISFVDAKSRVSKNAKLWFKGKDPDYWLPNDDKKYDYLLIGRRGDKNERLFLRRLDKIKKKRKILWIGGAPFANEISSNHDIEYTDFIGQNEVKELIPTAKVGILFTEHKSEGFPQSFLEMTMCGVPVIYNRNAPGNEFYFHKHNCILTDKKNLIKDAERLLVSFDSEACRKEAIENYSIQKSYESIINA